ncbi:ankyrin repeat protein [Rhodotorula toruloides]|uniref:Ankyrin repeat protein n=1 Tax=Rhodotorula toruloides TaxID=5286 RepID=A0A511KE97_RHOTO|nr:ankyrin repeat protein [Rhodotorula toruloides]
MAFVNGRDPTTRFRAALAASTPRTTLAFLTRLADRLPTDDAGNRDYRNTDPQTRETSLHLAAHKGRADLCEWLLEEGVDDDEVSRDVLGETVLHIAAANGFVEILELYLSRYAFVLDWVNSRGMTPLHAAALKGQAEAAQMLLDYGADINAPDLNGNTPLHYACAWGHWPVMKLLIDLDCDQEPRNNEGFSPAEYAYSFSTQKDFDGLVQQHREDVKTARRASSELRRRSKNSPQTIRSKRKSRETALSISVPSPTVAGEGDEASTGATRSATAGGLGEQYAFANVMVVPQLGDPIPPTPLDSAPVSPASVPPQPPFPPVDTTSEPPSTPRTPSSNYHNTTSPQPSPLSSPALTASRRLSLLSFSRHTQRSVSGGSQQSTPTGTAPSVTMGPSPARSAVGTVSESGETATPTTASPVPAGGRVAPTFAIKGPRGERNELYAEEEARHGLPYPLAAPVPVHAPAPTAFPANSSYPASPSPPPVPPTSPLTQHPSPPHPPLPHLAAPAHNKLIRKSRSHAHHPSLAGAGEALLAAGPPGQRSVSGPPLASEIDSPRSSSDFAPGRSTPSLALPTSAFADALGPDERRKVSGGSTSGGGGHHKLRKEHRSRKASHGNLDLLSTTSRIEEDVGGGKEKHQGRLARVFGLARK